MKDMRHWNPPLWQIYSSICHTLLGAQFACVIWVNICTHYFDRSILQFCQTLLRAQFSRVIWVNVCAKFHCSRQLSHVMKKNLIDYVLCMIILACISLICHEIVRNNFFFKYENPQMNLWQLIFLGISENNYEKVLKWLFSCGKY